MFKRNEILKNQNFIFTKVIQIILWTMKIESVLKLQEIQTKISTKESHFLNGNGILLGSKWRHSNKLIIIFLSLFLSPIILFSQSKYNIVVQGEKTYYYVAETPFKDFINAFSRENFTEAINIKDNRKDLIDKNLITIDTLTNIHHSILNHIPFREGCDTIFVLFGREKDFYYSKYTFDNPNTRIKRKDFFIQINFFIKKENGLIHKVKVCLPENCKQIKKYKPLNSKKILRLQIILSKNNVLDNSSEVKRYYNIKYKEKLNREYPIIWEIK